MSGGLNFVVAGRDYIDNAKPHHQREVTRFWKELNVISLNSGQRLIDAEHRLIHHIEKYGRRGYPIRVAPSGGWEVRELFGVGGFPIPFRARRYAEAWFEEILSIAGQPLGMGPRMTSTVVFFAPYHDRKHKAEQERDIEEEPVRFFGALLIAVPFSALCWYGLYWVAL